MAVHQVGDMSYHVNNRLLAHWQKNSLEIMKKTNSDRVYIVDGMERVGKSLYTFQQAGVLDKKMFSTLEEFLRRVCFTPEEFFNAIRTIKNGVIVFDESFRGMSSRSALSRVNKKLIQGLMEMGQNNNIVFIVLPRIWLLDLYPAMLRSHGLFNISLDKKNGKRVWKGYNYNDKNKIFQDGAKKGWKYSVNTFFRGNFYNKFPGGQEFERAYLKKKAQSLKDMDKDSEPKSGYGLREKKLLIQRNLALVYIYQLHNSFAKASAELKKYNFVITSDDLRNVYLKTKELLPQELQLPPKVAGLTGKAAEMSLK